MKAAYLIALTLVLIVTSDISVSAQSKDRDNPTKLTSNVVSDRLAPDQQGNKYYYSFVANPGDITVTLTLESQQGSNIVQAGLSLFDERDVQIGTYKVATAYSGGMQQVVENFTIRRRQTVTALVYVTPYNTGRGTYRLRISGL